MATQSAEIADQAVVAAPGVPVARMQRAHGVASVVLKAGGRLERLRQQGCAKAILPHVSGAAEVVFLNTSGGLTGGDRLAYALELAAGVRATATTQTAERAYRAAEGVATMEVSMRLGAGAWLDWLPQETILFDRAALERDTRIELGADAGCLICEAVVLGRAAMHETLRATHLRDRRQISRAGRPVLVDAVRLDDAALTSGAAALGGARAFASLAMVAQNAQDALAAVRAVLDEPGSRAAASGLDGRLQIRILAQDGWPLRRQIARILSVLRRDAGLPRVWQM